LNNVLYLMICIVLVGSSILVYSWSFELSGL
jgi:hypothetical protein